MSAGRDRGTRLRSWSAAAAALVGLLAIASSAHAASLEPIGTYASPVYVTSDPNDESRLFVVEKGGTIKLTTNGATTSFLDQSATTSTSGEEGLLSMAFAPDFATSHRFYVGYTGTPDGALHVDELIANGDVADPSSRRSVITIPHSTATNHNGGQLQFGPDGYLFISTGDGGNTPNTAQDTNSLLGKILRIDPRASGGAPYTVPADNPFVGAAGADEIWSYGLRNPWRFSFDRATGALVIGDVGQSAWEEVDFEPPSAGGGRGDNFGWQCREGMHDFQPTAPGCAGATFTEPVLEYPHSGGACAITGGYVVRDPGIPELAGRYVYADLCTAQLRSAVLGLPTASDDRSEGLSVGQPSSFGEDACGRVYVASLATGVVSRIVGASPTDCTAPAAPTIIDTDPDSPANDNQPEVKGAAEAGSTVRVYESNDCSGPVAAQGNAAAFASPGLTTTVADDQTQSFTATVADATGNTSACSAPFTYVEDSTAPTPGRIVGRLSPFSLASRLVVSWGGAADMGSGIGGYETLLRSARNDGHFGPPALIKATSGPGAGAIATRPGRSYCFRVRATDNAGNTSDPGARSCTTLPVDDAGLEGPGWVRVRNRQGHYQGTYSRSSTRGATLSLDGVWAKRIALLAYRCPGCGTVEVRQRGTLLETINLDSSAARRQQLIRVASFTSIHGGSVTIVVASSGKQIIIDGLGLSRF